MTTAVLHLPCTTIHNSIISVIFVQTAIRKLSQNCVVAKFRLNRYIDLAQACTCQLKWSDTKNSAHYS